MPEQNGSRLDRIEAILERMGDRLYEVQTGLHGIDQRLDRTAQYLERIGMRQDQADEDKRILFRSQVLMSESLEKLTARVDQLAEAQRATEERLNALIGVLDDLVRRQPPPAR